MGLTAEVERSFPKIRKYFTKEGLARFEKLPATELDEYMLGIGTRIELRLLKPEKELYKEFVNMGYTDKKEMTRELLQAYHTYLNKYNRVR